MKRLFSLVMFWVCFNSASATVFTVISNADSGPGTLREAITLANANGTVVVDYIHFNIAQPVFTLRMIELVTELPALSSNIILDGTTQPGQTYGTTEAKVCLKKDDWAASFSMLSAENAQNVEIYGMVLYYGYLQGLFLPPFRSSLLYGIRFSNVGNLHIGDVGKGNVITGVVHSIFSDSETSTDVFIKCNYLGQGAFYSNSTLEIAPVILMSECCITLGSVKNITIGGSIATEGNVFGSTHRAINIDSKNSTGNGLVTIRNNIFGRKYDRVTLVSGIGDVWDAYITFGRSRNNPVPWTLSHLIDYKLVILDNDIPGHMRISHITDSLIIKRNRFTEDMRNAQQQYKLLIGQCSGGGIIGGENEADSNSFKKKMPSNMYTSLGIVESGPITVLKNVFECNSVWRSTTDIWRTTAPFIPFAQVDSTAAGFARGRATAGTRVDLYYDDECTACEGRRYLASVFADANGQWTYTGVINGTVVAAATSTAGYTGSFSAPVINSQNMLVKHPTCGKNNGSVTNITSEGADSYFWLNYQTMDTVSHTIELLNVGPGNYLLFGVHGGTCISPMNSTVTLVDNSPKIIRSGAYIIHPACGLFNGAVNGLSVTGSNVAVYKWINSAGQTVGNSLTLSSAGPGIYHFVYTDTTATGGCSDTATFVLVNQSGPSLNTSNMVITPATCSNANGSITAIDSINVTGTAFIQWTDSLNNPVGNSLDLLNIMPGRYRLKFKDQSSCDTIITSYYTVTGIGNISIDTTGKTVTPSKCSTNTGSIANIKAVNGQAYTWINTATNAVMGNTINLTGMPPGNYQLTVSNSNGCSKQTPVITIGQTSFVPIAVTAYNLQHALCAQNNGAINLTSFNNTASLFSFRWVDSVTAQTVGAGTSITNLAGGTYQFFATDTNGCQQKIFSAIVNSMPMPVFDYTTMQLQNDLCNLNAGSIKNIRVANLTGPSVYTWVNQNNISSGSTLNLQNAAAGTYTLKITDGGICNIQSTPIIITNTNLVLQAPLYNNLVIPRFSNAELLIKNTATGSYLLLPTATATIPLQQNISGNFTIPTIKSDTVFYIKQLSGSCSSAPVAVSIKVVDKSFFTIPTAFTPNGDGRNDLLRVRVTGQIELKYFKVFNKWGELVFETNNYSDGWDGKHKGEMQNTGSYIWFAEGRDIQGNTVADKGMFTLIR